MDVQKVRSIQATIARILGSTFASRRGRFGEPVIGIGHYAGLIDIGGGNLLGLHTDNVGTKVLIAQQLKIFDTVGIDCVAMTVNDLICLGCEPVALLDHINLESEDAKLAEQIAIGLAKGAKEAEAPIVGGETAIVGEIVRGIDGRGFDLVSMGVGVVKKGAVIDGSAIQEGDAIVGIGSSGLHSNGYTLARKILRGLDLGERVEELGETIGEALLRPTRIYVRPTLRVVRRREVHGIAHITGGAFTKLTRLAGKRKLQFRMRRFEPKRIPPIFGFLQRRGGLGGLEMYRTFNMGVGLCLVVPPKEVAGVVEEYVRLGFGASEIGVVRKGEGVLVDGDRL